MGQQVKNNFKLFFHPKPDDLTLSRLRHGSA